MGKDVIIACDFSSADDTYRFLDRFRGSAPFVKIGMELFYAEGPAIVKELKKRGHSIFLDLKLHDIPNTVRKSMAVLSRLDIDMVNLHAAGTKAMMKAAMEGLTSGDCPEILRKEFSDSLPGGGKRPLLLAVTILTSIDEAALRGDLLIGASVPDTVIHYAKNAADSGLDGVVCSPLEAATVHDACGSGFLTVTPGVRFADGDIGDQKRVMTPEAANKAGSDYIVVGRPITAAEDPEAAYLRCMEEFTQ